MKSAFLAKNAKPGRARNTQIVTLPAPIAGWSTAGSLANPTPATAQVLENWRPTTTGIRARGGSRTHATVSIAGDPVESLISFNAPSGKKLFAATETKIFDVTTVADPVVPPAAVVTGQTNGYYSYTDFTTSGTEFLTIVNGHDLLRLYDPVGGWQVVTGVSAPVAITGIASTAMLSFVWVYRQRQFFIQASTLLLRYLPVSSVGGALGTVDLNGVFQRGGSLYFGSTWSMDTGDGLDDKIVLVTDQGEVAVYQGSNPADANDWQLVGRYDLAEPLGPRGSMHAGGDLLILTEDGIVPISVAVSKDRAAIDLSTISREIGPDWRREAAARRTLPWEIVKWPERSYAIVNCPVTNDEQQPICFVVNTQTGAWCKYTNWDTRCMILHAGQLYFGTNDGRVKLAEVGGNDDGAGIYYSCVANPDNLGVPGAIKTVHQARATYIGSTPFIDKLSVSMNYTIELPSPPDATADISSNEWDSGLWDVALWDGPESPVQVLARWRSIGRSGYVMQWQSQITGGLTPLPDTELVSIDVSFEIGATIV